MLLVSRKTASGRFGGQNQVDARYRLQSCCPVIGVAWIALILVAFKIHTNNMSSFEGQLNGMSLEDTVGEFWLLSRCAWIDRSSTGL